MHWLAEALELAGAAETPRGALEALQRTRRQRRLDASPEPFAAWPIEAESAYLLRWVHAALDGAEASAPVVAALTFTVRWTRWQDRVDASELALGWGPESESASAVSEHPAELADPFPSAVLTRIARLAPAGLEPGSAPRSGTQPGPWAPAAALVYAAASIRCALEGLDPSLVLGRAYERTVDLVLPPLGHASLGGVDEHGWTSE